MMVFRSLDGSAPGDCALICDGVTVSGRVLNRTVETIAQRLSTSGLTSGQRVAVMQGQGFPFAACVLALMKVGASSVLLSPRSTPRDVAEAIRRTDLVAILGDARVGAALTRVPALHATETIDLPRDASPIQMWQTGSRAASASPGEATVQLTSGVSGRSKIVARTMTQLEDELQSFTSHLGLSSDDATVCPCPLFHTYGFVNGFLLPLFSGRPAILIDWFLPNTAVQAVRRHRARVFVGVPTMYRAIADAYGTTATDLESLRLCFSAGAPLPSEVAHAFGRRYGLQVNQQYGTTETGVIAVNLLDGAEVLAAGRPIIGREIEILGEDGAPVAAGACGTVAVRSPASATAYVGDPELSAQRFQRGRYLTGDLGSYSGGVLRLTGRQTSFINVAGVKVDPQEIEDVLAACDSVVECAVVPVKDRTGGEVVKAVVVVRDDVTAKTLQQFCRRRLAAHKVPRHVTFVDALPRSATGKVLVNDLIDGA